MLWVSIDGASAETYTDVRLGAELPKIIENVSRVRRMRKGGHFPQPDLGFAFLAMQRNIDDLPEVIRLGISLGVKHFTVSNVQPATEEMQNERLYMRTMRNIAYLPSSVLPRLILPKIDFNETTQAALTKAFNSGCNVNFAGNNWGGANDTCTFVESGTMSIAWNGDVSPCWPLMHTHTSYLHNKKRLNKKHVIGNVSNTSLEDIWLDEKYLAYREKLHNFSFAPCTFCGGCDLSEANEEDCIGNDEFPVCGGCLWAQGIIQCP
jgi:MoaA/NifB/PqqE/SkfB family radical SAM enzyme